MNPVEFADLDDFGERFQRVCDLIAKIHRRGPNADLSAAVERSTSEPACRQAQAIVEVALGMDRLEELGELAARAAANGQPYLDPHPYVATRH